MTFSNLPFKTPPATVSYFLKMIMCERNICLVLPSIASTDKVPSYCQGNGLLKV